MAGACNPAAWGLGSNPLLTQSPPRDKTLRAALPARAGPASGPRRAQLLHTPGCSLSAVRPSLAESSAYGSCPRISNPLLILQLESLNVPLRGGGTSAPLGSRGQKKKKKTTKFFCFRIRVCAFGFEGILLGQNWNHIIVLEREV